MTPKTILTIIIAILLFDFILERILDYLNSKSWSNELPSRLKGIYDADKYKKSQDYDKTKQRFSVLADSLNLSLMLLMLIIGGFAFIDSFVRQYTQNSILLAIGFFGIIGIAADIIGTPFSIYNTFVIEEKFGFNKTTVKTYIFDKLKGWALGAIIGGGLLSLVVWFYESTGEYFWIYIWIVVCAFMIFMAMFYSSIIVPLFNKQTPLEEGELRTAIEEYADKTGFKLKNIFKIDGSKRSSKANAYFSGLGAKKRIVLFDTLINDLSKEEIVAVLAHEVGHYKMKHTLISIFTSVIQTGLMLFILSLFIDNPLLSKSLGADIKSFHMGIMAFGILYSPFSTVMGLGMNIISRKNEYTADAFAGTTYKAEYLQSALKKLSVNNLSNLNPHKAYVFFYYSHPTLLNRLEALDKISR